VRYAKNAPSHPPTLPEDIEYLAVRMLALDACVGIETTLDDLKGNGRTEEALRLFGQYEALRLPRRLPETARARLQQGAWHLASHGAQETIQAIERTVVTTDVPGEVAIENRFKRQALRFRVEVEPAVAAAGDPANLLLLGQAITLRVPAASEPMPGALAERIELTQAPQPLDLRHHRTLAVTLRVDGFDPAAPISTINIQLQNGINYRDHYVDLDFNGEKTILLREPDAERMLGELRPDPRNYAFKAALRDFSYQSVSSVNVRWMRVAGTATSRCSITRIEALAEADIPLSHVEIGIGSTKIVVPTPLATGAYVESSGDGVIRWFDENGHTLGTAAPVSPLPDLAPGKNTLTLKASERGAIKVSVWTSEGEIDLASPPGRILRRKGFAPPQPESPEGKTFGWLAPDFLSPPGLQTRIWALITHAGLDRRLLLSPDSCGVRLLGSSAVRHQRDPIVAEHFKVPALCRRSDATRSTCALCGVRAGNLPGRTRGRPDPYRHRGAERRLGHVRSGRPPGPGAERPAGRQLPHANRRQDPMAG
jgi:hypothetical protein